MLSKTNASSCVTCAANAKEFLEACRHHILTQDKESDSWLVDLPNTAWEKTLFHTPVDKQHDPVALTLANEMEALYEQLTFDCPDCGAACSFRHFIEVIRPLATELAFNPVCTDVTFITAHQSGAVVQAAMHTFLDRVHHEVLPRYGGYESGIFYLDFSVATTRLFERRLGVHSYCHEPEACACTWKGVQYRAYPCFRVTPGSVEGISLPTTFGDTPVYVTGAALAQLQKCFFDAFSGEGIPGTLAHALNESICEKNTWPTGEQPGGDSESYVTEFKVGKISCGWLAGVAHGDSLILTAFSPWEPGVDYGSGEWAKEIELPVTELAKLLRAKGPLAVADGPGLMKHAAKNLTALVAELRQGEAPPYDIAAVRELMRRNAEAKRASADGQLSPSPAVVPSVAQGEAQAVVTFTIPKAELIAEREDLIRRCREKFGPDGVAIAGRMLRGELPIPDSDRDSERGEGARSADDAIVSNS